jgi:hypothetical protein
MPWPPPGSPEHARHGKQPSPPTGSCRSGRPTAIRLPGSFRWEHRASVERRLLVSACDPGEETRGPANLRRHALRPLRGTLVLTAIGINCSAKTNARTAGSARYGRAMSARAAGILALVLVVAGCVAERTEPTTSPGLTSTTARPSGSAPQSPTAVPRETPTAAEQGLVRALVEFARSPNTGTLGAVPFADRAGSVLATG